MIHAAANQYDDIEGKSIADLGIGCGVLSIGCCLMGASSILGCDIDSDALRQANSNMNDLNDTIDLVQIDVSQMKIRHGLVDTV